VVGLAKTHSPLCRPGFIAAIQINCRRSTASALACLLALELTEVRWLQGIPNRESITGPEPMEQPVDLDRR
jgi:hypothetical protein